MPAAFEGDPNSPICLVGEAPAKREFEEDRPFVGPAGGVLARCLEAAGISRSEIYITNTFDFMVKKANNGAITYEGLQIYSDRSGFSPAGLAAAQPCLERIANCGANVIVPLGNVAMTLAHGVGKPIGKWRGSLLPAPAFDSRKTVGTYHPAAVCWGSTHFQHIIATDLARAKSESFDPAIRQRERRLVTDPTFATIKEWLEALANAAAFAFDTELRGSEVTAMSFAIDESEAICIPFITRTGPRFTPRELAYVRDAIRTLLQGPARKINQNIAFDVWAMRRIWDIDVAGPFDDPMVLHHIVYPDFPKSLGFLCSWLTDQPYYKDDGGSRLWANPEKNFPKFWEYSALDACIALECWNRLEEMFLLGDESPWLKTYRETIELIPAIVDMETTGVRVDVAARAAAAKAAKELAAQHLAEVQRLAGREINPASPKQMASYFYGPKSEGGLGLEPYTNKLGAVTTDELAMSRLARKGVAVAQRLLDYREQARLASTYLEMPLDTDGRFRASYNIRGTTTGRLSSSKQVTGNGGNAQNLPSIVQKFLVADPGHVLVELDLAGAEWVIVAHLTADPAMLAVAKSGRSPHVATASLMFGVSEELVLEEEKLLEGETNADRIAAVRKDRYPEIFERATFLPKARTLRQSAKGANHSLNYGLGYKQFSLRNNIAETEGKQLVKLYREKAYPGIVTWHKHVVETVREVGYLTNCFGRRRQFLSLSDDANDYYAFLPQSTVADVVRLGMVEAMKWQGEGVRLLMQIHDSIVLQLPAEPALVMDCIAAVTAAMRPTLCYNGGDFVLGVDSKIGLTKHKRSMASLTAVSVAAICRSQVAREEFGDLLEPADILLHPEQHQQQRNDTREHAPT